MSISKKNLLEAYKNGNNEIKKMFKSLFGADTFRPKNITERVKTFEDACAELGEDHPFVVAYRNNENIDKCAGDIEAYLKLRIITAAINEGWKPQFVQGEYRYYPWFFCYTNEEIKNLNNEEKSKLCRVVGRASFSAHAYGGLVYSYAVSVSTFSGTGGGSRLAFRTKELAEYAGKQFIEIYRDFII